MKTTIFSLCSAAFLTVMASCGNEGNGTADSDTSTTGTTGTAGTTGTESSTSTGDYSALADTFRMNSEAGRYLDVRTGKPIRINVDRSTGARLNAETNEPVRRYIYKNNDTDWWVYDDQGTQLSRARMQNNKVMFEGDNNDWVDYDMKWKDETTGVKTEIQDNGNTKMKTEDGDKIKTEKDGDVKIKKADGTKIKKDEDGIRIKKDNDN